MRGFVAITRARTVSCQRDKFKTSKPVWISFALSGFYAKSELKFKQTQMWKRRIRSVHRKGNRSAHLLGAAVRSSLDWCETHRRRVCQMPIICDLFPQYFVSFRRCLLCKHNKEEIFFVFIPVPLWLHHNIVRCLWKDIPEDRAVYKIIISPSLRSENMR